MAEENQLIDGDGHFNERDIKAFKKKFNLNECGLSYQVVSIMGPQSSGKSTLLNHLFHTNFREMDAKKRRSQTTKGIWLAWGDDIHPCTIVLDLEGSDGRERGEGDTSFEKHSALFALAVSDIVLINMWYHDIGREHAAQKPLLKTVFQVMTRLFSPRKTTLLFVIRDISETPLEELEGILREDTQKIWDSIRKPEAYSKTPLGEIFNVEVVALPNYKHETEQFKEQVASLRQRFYHSISPGGLVGDQRTVVPAAEFFFSAQKIWKCIKGNKDLNLPAHTIMVATIRCDEIAKEKFDGISSDETWRQLKNAVQHGLMPHFGSTLSRLLDKFLSGYDMETQYFDDDVKSAKRTQLESELLQLAYPAYESMLSHLQSKTLDDFKEAFHKALDREGEFAVAVRDCAQPLMSVFDARCKEAVVEQSNWDCLKVREKIRQDIDAHVVHADKLSELKVKYEGQLNKALVKPVEALLDNDRELKVKYEGQLNKARAKTVEALLDNDRDLKVKYEGQLNKALVKPVEALLDTDRADTWLEIRKLLKRETESALSGLASALCAFDIDRTTTKKLLDGLERCARKIVECKMREEVARVSIRMKDRFLTMFTRDPNGMPREWTSKKTITATTTAARSAALELLSVMAAIRMDDNSDNIFNTLSLSLLSVTDKTQSDVILTSSSWEKVPLERMLITPVQCESLWELFIAETDVSVTQAIASYKKNKLKRHAKLAGGIVAGGVTVTAGVLSGGLVIAAGAAGLAGVAGVAAIASAASFAGAAKVARNARGPG